MLGECSNRISPLRTESDGTFGLIRRLLTEYGSPGLAALCHRLRLDGRRTACTGQCAYLAGDIVNQAYVKRDLTGVVVAGVLALLMFTLRGAAIYGQAVMLSRIGNRIVADNQRRLFDKLLQENLGFFSDRHSSEFIARLTTGAAAARSSTLLITSVGRDLFTLLGLFAVMVMQDPVMSLFALAIAPPAVLLMRKLVRRIRTVAFSQFTGGTRILETMQETVQGIRIVKAFTLEDTMRARFDANVTAVEREANKMARVGHRTGPLMETLGGIAIALAIIYGGYRDDRRTARRPAGSSRSWPRSCSPMSRPSASRGSTSISTPTLVGVRMLFEIIDSPATEPSDDDKPALKLTTARVEFADVRFAYRPGEPVLRGLSFVAEPGKVTALVGPSGGGKSTILNLILRFYEVDGGAITIDGQNIAAVSRRSLRRQIAYVGQDVFLFRGSVRDNIAFGKPGASEAEIVAAAKAAHAHDFIMGFPAGYDTPVGEHGLQLSGGERQRVAIARALIKNAPIILLDEATAALDSESERHVQEAIAELCKGRTTIVIAHRLSTIMHADRILVIEGGDDGRGRPPRRAVAQGRPLCLVLPPAAQAPRNRRRSLRRRQRPEGERSPNPVQALTPLA